MTEETPLDRAHAAMAAAPDEDAARLRFYERLAEAELFMLLRRDAEGAQITPEIFEIDDASFVLVFDLENRLTGFTGRAVPYAALSGRAIAAMLAAEGLGLALNIDVAPSAFLLPPPGVAWLAQILADQPGVVEQPIARVFAPGGLPEVLLPALDAKLATAAGMAEMAYLVGVEYESGVRGHLLGLLGTAPGAEAALAQAVAEALRFSGLEAATLDVGFFEPSDALAAALAREGLRFDLPVARRPKTQHAPPGSTPDKPPILR